MERTVAPPSWGWPAACAPEKHVFVHRVTQALTYTAQNSNLPPYKINSYNCVSYLNNRLFDRGEVLLIYWHHIHLGVEIHGNF